MSGSHALHPALANRESVSQGSGKSGMILCSPYNKGSISVLQRGGTNTSLSVKVDTTQMRTICPSLTVRGA